MQKKKENKQRQPPSKQPAKTSLTVGQKYYGPLLMILLISFLVYLPALRGGFVWDDDDYVRNNALAHSINLKQIFFGGHQSFVVGNYHPVTVLMLAIEYHFFGVVEKGYHVINLLLHLLNVLLVFRVVLLLSENSRVALIAALLFGIHPIHVESVAWVSELKDLLYTFFFLASYFFYLKHLRDKKNTFYTWSLLLFLLSLLSKAMAASLPVLLILTDYFKGTKINVKSLLAKVPFFLLAIILGLVAIKAQKTAGATEIADFSFPQRIVFACYGFMMYLVKLALPLNLSAYYPYPIVSGSSLPVEYYFYVIVFLALAAFVYYSLRFSKKILLGIGFFTITVFLVLQLLPVGGAVMADRYGYIPSIGIFYLLAEGIMWLWNKKNAATSWKMPATIGLGIASIFYCTQTYARCGTWKDGLTLWNDVISRYQTIAPAYINRGIILASLKRNDEALSDYNKAIELGPKFPKGYSNRGVLYKDMKRYDDALKDYNKAIELQQDYPIPYNNRGVLFKIENKFDEALNDYNKAIQLNPEYTDAFYNRAVVYKIQKRYDESLNDYNHAIKLRPNNASIYNSRGSLFANQDKFDEAYRDYSKAIALQHDFASAYYNRGLLLAKVKKRDEALNDYNKAIELQPSMAEAYYSKGVLEFDAGKKDAGCNDIKKSATMGYQPAMEDYKNICH